MSEWQEYPYLTESEYRELPASDRAIVDCQPNKWQIDHETGRVINAEHPANEEWRLMREAVEARALLR